MSEDPRDERQPHPDEPQSEQDVDEISLDELDEESLSLLSQRGQGGEPLSQDPLRVIDDLPTSERDDDEIQLEELDDETAGYFEVSAVGGSGQAPGGAPDESMYEVEAAPAPRPQQTEWQPRQETHEAGGYHSSTPQSDADVESESIRRLHNVEVEVVATLGTTRMQIKDILGLHVGSVVELHRLVGEPVDVTLNGRLIARGEVVVVDEKFAVRVSELAPAEE